MSLYPNYGAGVADLEGLQHKSTELGDFGDLPGQSQCSWQQGIYGTFKAGLKKDSDNPQVWLAHAVKFFSAIAICGILLSHLLEPMVFPLNKGGGRVPSVAHSSSKDTLHTNHTYNLGHCTDLEPATCASWFKPNGGHDSTAMCAADLMRAKPICSRSCGTCAIMLAGCKKLKTMDIGQDCKVGEDVVGEVCMNDDRQGESYCTYVPPAADGTKATFVCGVCHDPLAEIGPERQVILAQMKELRNEEISREDEKFMTQTHHKVNTATNKLGDLLWHR